MLARHQETTVNAMATINTTVPAPVRG